MFGQFSSHSTANRDGLSIFFPSDFLLPASHTYSMPQNDFLVPYRRGGEWYLENSGSRKFVFQSRNLGEVLNESRNLVFVCFFASWFLEFLAARSRSLRFFYFQYSDWLSRYLHLLDVRVAKNLQDVFAKSCHAKQKIIFLISKFLLILFFVIIPGISWTTSSRPVF